jgi:hypothetical protein
VHIASPATWETQFWRIDPRRLFVVLQLLSPQSSEKGQKKGRKALSDAHLK